MTDDLAYRQTDHRRLPVVVANELSADEVQRRQADLGERLLHYKGTHMRASDKGFLPMPTAADLELLDWTARQLVSSSRVSGVQLRIQPPRFLSGYGFDRRFGANWCVSLAGCLAWSLASLIGSSNIAAGRVAASG